MFRFVVGLLLFSAHLELFERVKFVDRRKKGFYEGKSKSYFAYTELFCRIVCDGRGTLSEALLKEG
jgi:hypothetical protein